MRNVSDASYAGHILCVDGHARTRSATVRRLTNAGYRVTTAPDFDGACRQMSLEPPDLVLTVVRLGRFNGLHLALRCQCDTPTTPVIVLSDPADDALEVDAVQLGARFVRTSTSPGEVRALIAKLLAERPVEVAVPYTVH